MDSSALSLDESLDDFARPSSSSTPKAQRRRSSTPVHAFKVPSVPQTKVKAKAKTPNFVCTYCLKGFVQKKYHDAHVRVHRLQDAAAIFPDADKVIEAVVPISTAALTKVANAPCADCCPAFKQLVGVIITLSSSDEWTECVSSLCGKVLGSALNSQIMLPSALVKVIYENVENFLASSAIVNDHIALIGIPKDFSSEVKDQFFLEFMLSLGQEVIGFISKTFREKHPSSVSHQFSHTLDEDERQVIYYIGGSLIRSYIRMAHRYQTSKKWQMICSALKGRVTCEEPTNDEEQDSSWTKKVSRGGLIFITPEFQNFLVALTLIVYACEDSKGAIDYVVVTREVSKSDVSVMWDRILFDSLPPTVSLQLMNDFIERYCRTCIRGFAKRRLNSQRSRPVISMPTRHAVARRKK